MIYDILTLVVISAPPSHVRGGMIFSQVKLMKEVKTKASIYRPVITFFLSHFSPFSNNMTKT